MRQFETKRSFNFKKTIPLLLILVFLLIPLQANAAILTEEDIEAQEKPGILEKQFSKFVLNVANSLIAITGAQDVSVLVFQRPEVANTDTWISNTTSSNRSELVYGVFPEGAFNGIAEIYDNLVNLLPIPMVVIIALAGLFLLFDIIRSTDNRSKIKEYLLGLMGAILLLRFGYLIWDWILFINYSFLVDPIYFMLQNNGIQITSFISTIWDQGSTDTIFGATNFFVALVVGCAAFMTFSINYQYMLRIVMLGVLIVLFPFAVICTVIPSRRNVLNQWFMMFTSQVFLQGAHAIALGLFFLMLATGSGLDFWLCLVMFFGLPMISDLIQRFVGSIFGDASSSGGIGKSMSNASGISSAMGMVALGKNMMKSKGTSSGTSSSSKSSSRLTNNTGNNGSGSSGITQHSSSMKNSGGMSNSDNKERGLETANGINPAISESPQQNGRNGMFGNLSNSNTSDAPNRSLGNKMENSSGSSMNIGSSMNNNAPISSGTMDQSLPVSDSNGLPNNQVPYGTPNAKQSKGDAIAKVAGSTGRKISEVSRNVGNSERLKRGMKLATMGGVMVGGAAVGTMLTGSSKNGMMLGAATGALGGKGLEFATTKGAKIAEVGGELLQSKSKGKPALNDTQERIGYNDKSQLKNPPEMARMGRELIGGRTGEVLGSTVGKINNATSRKDSLSPPTINNRARQNNETPQNNNNNNNHNNESVRQNKNNSHSNESVRQNNNNGRINENEKGRDQITAKSIPKSTATIAQSNNKSEQFYERQKLKSELGDLGQTRKSSGKLS